MLVFYLTKFEFLLLFLQMVQAIQVLRFHLLELEKVSNDFPVIFLTLTMPLKSA